MSWTPSLWFSDLCGALLAAFVVLLLFSLAAYVVSFLYTLRCRAAALDYCCRACLALWKRGRLVLMCSSRACIT